MGVVPTAVVGFAFAPLFPGAMLVAEELLGGAMSGRAASLIVTAAAAGESFFPMATGAAIPTHPNWFSWIMLASCCAMLAIFSFNASNVIFSVGACQAKDEVSKASGIEHSGDQAQEVSVQIEAV